jgi:phenylpropionate dioxygenase-like ring-hydroxylating dioxygenase large terminal subunit
MEWTPVARSEIVEPGAVVEITVDGRGLVLWRGRSGVICVMDARCPHQWSPLGAEGRVDGDELVCTAHFWRFDREGCGTKVTVLGRRDPKADIRVHPSRERDGMVEVLLGTTQLEGPPQAEGGVAR